MVLIVGLEWFVFVFVFMVIVIDDRGFLVRMIVLVLVIWVVYKFWIF